MVKWKEFSLEERIDPGSIPGLRPCYDLLRCKGKNENLPI